VDIAVVETDVIVTPINKVLKYREKRLATIGKSDTYLTSNRSSWLSPIFGRLVVRSEHDFLFEI